MTVNSSTSLSLELPLVLVRLEKIARTHRLETRTGEYGVEVLLRDQQEISGRLGGHDIQDNGRFQDSRGFGT